MAAILLGLSAAPAGALAPCFDVCHLSQGQPLLLVDARQLWVRRRTPSEPVPRVGAPAKYILERVGLDGRVLARLPDESTHDDDQFEARHLRGHKVVGLAHQSPWRDLTRPYRHTPIGHKALTLRLVKNSLVCTSASTTVRRPLGCVPTSVYVLATGIGRDSKPEEPWGVVAVIATCKQQMREAIAICQSSP